MKYSLALFIFLPGCASTPQFVDTSCSWVKPIFVSSQDKLTNKTASAILAHDDKWQQFCGAK